MAVGVSSKVQKECGETSVLPGNRKGENFIFLQGSFISCLGGFSGLCNYCVIFSPCPFGVEGCGLPGEEEVGREQDRRRCWWPAGTLAGSSGAWGCATSEVEEVDRWRRLQSLCRQLSACLVSVNPDRVHRILVSPFSSLPLTAQHLLPACPQLTRWVPSRTVFSLEIVFVHPVVLTQAVGTWVHLTICKPLGAARF